MSFSIIKLSPGYTDYAWGKKGSSSLCAQLAEVSIPQFELKETQPYAELWMGTHPKLPSRLPSGELLSSYLKANPSQIGDQVSEAFPQSRDGALPFLLKVLSIGKALSIQAHPDKKLGAELHAKWPDIYTDGSHKPEMAIALTPFKAFLNFLPLQNVLSYLLNIPELALLVPSTIVETFETAVTSQSRNEAEPTGQQRAAMREVFGALMTAKEDQVKLALDTLVARYQKNNVNPSEKHLVDLALMLHDQFPGDIGVMCVFMLNVVDLKIGEAAFLRANEPHAYISGDIIECMATSDNVVRAGLTPMYRDIPTLVSMLTYNAGPGERQLLKPTPFGKDGKTLLYDPPIDEFSILKLDLRAGETSLHRLIDGPSICIVVQGRGKAAAEDIRRGEVLFIPAGSSVEWTADKDGLVLYRAFCQVA